MELLKYLLILSLGFLMTGCGGEEDEETTEAEILTRTSSIQIKPPYIENKALISLITPMNGESVSSPQDSNINLIYRLNGATRTSILLFKEKPTITDGVVSNFSDICLGGTIESDVKTGLNNNTLSLGTQTGNDALYACGVDQIEFLNLSKQLTVDEKLFVPGTTIYWMVLGYDDAFDLTHASALSKFEIGL